MLFASWKHPFRPCALGALTLVLPALVVIIFISSPSVFGQATTAGGGTVVATSASLEKELPPAPRLKPPYGQLKQLPEDKEKEYQSRKRSEIQRLLRSGTIPPDREAEFNDYYMSYALPRWTWINRLHEVAKYRNELAAELVISYKQGSNNQAHNKLQALTLQYMKNFVNPDVLARPGMNFSPVTRYNAILMVGELNQVEPSIGNRVPTPLPEAVPILRACAQDLRQIDAVRLGALDGMRRHCRLAMEKNEEPPRDVLGDMFNIVRTKDPQRVCSEEGHAWMRLIAVRTFGDVKGAPRPDLVAGILRDIVNETDSPAFLRYEAANALGAINYRNAGGINVEEILQAVVLLGIEVCDVERQRLRDEMESDKPPTASAYGYGGSGGYGEEMDMPSGSGYESDSMYGYGAMGAGPTTTASDRQIERVRRRLQEGLAATLIAMGRKSRSVREGEELGLNMMIENTKIESFSTPIHEFLKTIDAKDDKDKTIQAKPLDEAIADVRTKLADALTQIGGAAPESPEFEPIREVVQPAYGGSGYEMGSGSYQP